MKKILLFLAVIALLTSCNKDLNLDMKYQLTANVDILDVVKNLKDIDNSDLFPNGTIDNTDYKVRLSFLIYNSEGELVSKETQIIDDFSKTATISRSVDPGEYTIIAGADIVKIQSGNISLEFWKIENSSKLRDLKITDTGKKGFQYKALGISKIVENVEKSESIDIKVKPIGSLVTFLFSNINQQKISSLAYGWSKSSDYFLINEGTPNILTGLVSDEFEMESQYSRYYDQRYFLPIQENTFVWISYSPSFTEVLSGGIKFNIESGVNKTIAIDVDGGLTNESTLNKSARILKSENTLRIEPLPSTKIKLSY